MLRAIGDRSFAMLRMTVRGEGEDHGDVEEVVVAGRDAFGCSVNCVLITNH